MAERWVLVLIWAWVGHVHAYQLPAYGLLPTSLLPVCQTAMKEEGRSAQRTVLVTGANKGQGFALCSRILAHHADTKVVLCSRDLARGEHAASLLAKRFSPDRVTVRELDVTKQHSVDALASSLALTPLYGVVSNAGVMWDHSRAEVMTVCATGVRNVLDSLVPLCSEGGRVVVVSSGLGPLMHGYASPMRQLALKAQDLTWRQLEEMINECLLLPPHPSPPSSSAALSDTERERETQSFTEQLSETAQAFAEAGFPGGPFAQSAPDFHMYGLAKMFADAYMLSVARRNPSLLVNSCDPGLVYTDLMKKIPRYEGMAFEDTGAKSAEDGAEAALRLLFGGAQEGVVENESGRFYAMNKDLSLLLNSCIDKRPD